MVENILSTTFFGMAQIIRFTWFRIHKVKGCLTKSSDPSISSTHILIYTAFLFIYESFLYIMEISHLFL